MFSVHRLGPNSRINGRAADGNAEERVRRLRAAARVSRLTWWCDNWRAQCQVGVGSGCNYAPYYRQLLLVFVLVYFKADR